MATATQRLSEAEDALHRLLTGTAVVRVRDSNGDEVTYTRATLSDLKRYVRDLKDEIAGTVTNVTRPMRVRTGRW